MIAADAFLEPALARGFGFYTGVPCSFLTPVINRVISDPKIAYVGAASEGEAVAIAAGAWLAGKGTVVMCQNSGLGNTVNPLTSLNFPFRIPTLLVVTWRGQPGLKDEPQHELMGQITGALLDTMRIGHAAFPKSEGEVAGALDRAESAMAESALPFAFIMEKDTVRDDGLDQKTPAPFKRGAVESLAKGGARPRRFDVLERLLAAVPDNAAIIATTGKCGRELFTLADRKQHLYQVGSMGCASAMGLGVALHADRPVVVLDGDGAALMKMGSLATIGAYRPGNLVHIVLDNGVHDSTGGQATVSSTVDFAEIAAACGYPRAWSCDDLNGFETAFKSALGQRGPGLIHMRIGPGSLDKLGRPTVKPHEVAQRFKEFLAGA
jgi:phosphonopyruvate decarboxylase